MTHEDERDARPDSAHPDVAMGLSAGMSAGLVLGLLVFDNIGLGLALGTSLGLGVPALLRARRASSKSSTPPADRA
ncbi:hypothetical protein AB0D45_05510 [Streptomyces sp. NPDC048352]|uniref:hypothetical protein n=1 Tax=Streptomyces sp. NPDC048352 TaxID=3154718 RepID=UPI00343F7B2A